MSTALATVRGTFNGHPVITYTYRGRACWLVSDIGTMLGYKNGKTLNDSIRDRWNEELIRGVDYEIIIGKELKDFIKLMLVAFKSKVANPDSELAKIRSLTVLYESGLHMVLLKTPKKAGRKLRRYLVEEILPALARGEQSLPEKQGPSLEEKKFNQAERQFKYEITNDLLDRIEAQGNVDADIIAAYRVTAVEEATGMNMAALKPAAGAEMEQWQTPTAIAEQLGITPYRVGMIITDLKLRNDSRYSRAIINKARYSQRTVTSYIYSPQAVRMIARRARRLGLTRTQLMLVR